MANVTKKYLTKPFDNMLKDKDFHTDTNMMKIIVGTTGLGKTYTMYNSFIPTLFEKNDLDIIFVTFPLKEVYDRSEAEAVIVNTKGVVYSEEFEYAKPSLEKKRKVLLCVSNQLITNPNGNDFISYLISKGYKIGWFVDEPHMHIAASDISHYKDVMGSHTPQYNARLYKQVSKIARVSPYIFGLTATPTAEHTMLIEPFGDMKFRIINDYPDKKEIISATGWFGSYTPYELGTVGDPKETIDVFRDHLDNLFQKTETFGSKRVGMIICERENGSGGWNIDNVRDMIRTYLIHNNIIEQDTVAVLTSVFSGYLNLCTVPGINGYYKKLSEELYDESTIIKNLNDLNHPSKILLVIEKGKAGMNVHPLKSTFSFRNTDKERSADFDNEPILEMATQIMGRMMRINPGMDKHSFVEKYGYDLKNYVKSLNSVQRRTLLEENSFDLYTPNLKMWTETVRKVSNELCPGKTEASSWMSKIKKVTK